MQKSRTIFIGDVHGCYDELKLLLKKLDIQKKDMVYFVGDMIHRGPDSYKVIKLLYKNQEQYKAILGNHEVGFFKWLEGKAPHYEDEDNRRLRDKLKTKPEKLEFLKNLPLYIETDDFLLVHGGVKFDKKLEDHTAKELVNLRKYKGTLWYNHYKGDKKIIYGHNAVDGLQIRNNTIGLDTGCVYGKFLTAYVLETGEVHTQTAYDMYIDVYNKKNIFEIIKYIFKRK